MTRLKVYSTEILGTVASGTGAITARQEQFEWWLRNTGTAVAPIAAALTIVVILRKEWPHVLPPFLRPK